MSDQLIATRLFPTESESHAYIEGLRDWGAPILGPRSDVVPVELDSEGWARVCSKEKAKFWLVRVYSIFGTERSLYKVLTDGTTRYKFK